ncbi:MAG TPA: S-adenosylmethionine decarboxylase [Gemmatimonadales bacterium]|nr:S-adenosylmethionine decarboxylase [Gemmatimonadales bacterium]
MEATFNHYLLELTSVDPVRLSHPDSLSALVVAAAGAVGMPGLGPPVAREGAGEIAIALLCLEGHIVLHCVPAQGICLIDIVARAPADVGKGIEVISRRLAG